MFIRDCQEIYYIKKMAKIIGVVSIYGVMVYFMTDPFIMMLPTLGGESCFAMMVQSGGQNFILPKYYISSHELVYMFVNWIELAYLYSQWRRLQKLEQNQLNIKMEFIVAVVAWIIFSNFYILAALITEKAQDSVDMDGKIYFSDYLSNIGLLLRNLTVFYATTLQTIW